MDAVAVSLTAEYGSGSGRRNLYVMRFAEVSPRDERTGRLDARVGNCLGVLAGVILRALEGGELERRLGELEAGRAGRRAGR